MTDEIRPETQTIGPDNPQEQAAEPAVLHIAERILHSTDARSVSELLDVASIFYTAVATVLGSLVGACTYLLFRPFNPNALITLARLFALCRGRRRTGGCRGHRKHLQRPRLHQVAAKVPPG